MPNSHVWLTPSELDRAALDQVAWATVTALSFQGEKKKTKQDGPRCGRFGGFGEGLRDSFLETFPSGWAYSTYWQVEGNCDGGEVLVPRTLLLESLSAGPSPLLPGS